MFAARVWSTAGPVIANAQVEWHVSPIFMSDIVRRADGGTFFVAKHRVGIGRPWATFEDLESERMEFRVVPEGFRGDVGPRWAT